MKSTFLTEEMNDMVKCFDIVSMVVDEQTKELFLYKLNKEKLDILREYCEAIDTFTERFSVESIGVDVNLKNHVVITLDCSAPIISDNPTKDALTQLFDRAVSVGFSTTNGENVVMELVFPSVWDKKDIIGTRGIR